MTHASLNNFLNGARAAPFFSSSEDELRGKIGAASGNAPAPARLSRGLDKRLGGARRFGFRVGSAGRSHAFDARQRAIVKIHYFGHGGGGGAALKAHARYVARETAELDPDARAHGGWAGCRLGDFLGERIEFRVQRSTIVMFCAPSDNVAVSKSGDHR